MNSPAFFFSLQPVRLYQPAGGGVGLQRRGPRADLQGNGDQRAQVLLCGPEGGLQGQETSTGGWQVLLSSGLQLWTGA